MEHESLPRAYVDIQKETSVGAASDGRCVVYAHCTRDKQRRRQKPSLFDGSPLERPGPTVRDPLASID